MKREACLVAYLLLGLPLSVPALAQETPSLEFLEFLGQWENAEGQWLDPTELDEETTTDNGERYDHDR